MCFQVVVVSSLSTRVAGLTAGAAVLALAVAATAQQGSGLEDAVHKAMCGQRSPCRIVRTHDAGKTLLVVEVALHDMSGEDWKYPNLAQCAPWEVWLVTHDGHAVLESRRILELCNDGYGAAGLGEDMLHVEPNTLVHWQGGGSNWRWFEETSYQLDPFMITSTSTGSYWVLGASEETHSWDWRTRQGLVKWYQPECPELGEPGESELSQIPDLFAYQPIPLVTVDPSYALSGWKDTPIGSCGLHADATDDLMSGFLIHGAPSVPADGSMRALFVSETALIIQVEDDSLVQGKKDWIHGDHVQVWVGQDQLGNGKCIPVPGSPVQWGIDLSSGNVFPAFGEPSKNAIAVERVEDTDGTVRLKIVFVDKPGRITVVFSDSDDGESKERLIATSEIEHGNTWTLGKAAALPLGQNTCPVINGRLDFQP